MSKHNRQTCNKGIAALLRCEDYLLPIVLVCSGLCVAFNVNAQSNQDRVTREKNSQRATARSSRKKPSGYVNPCAVAPPNASLNLGPGILGFLPSFRVESGPTELVFQGKKLAAVTNYSGGFQLPDQLCAIYSQETLVFVKSAGTNEFNLIDSVIANGNLKQEEGNALTGPKSKCVLLPSTGKGALSIGLPFSFKPSKSGGKVFRVAVGVSLAYSQWQQVRVQASHDSDLK